MQSNNFLKLGITIRSSLKREMATKRLVCSTAALPVLFTQRFSLRGVALGDDTIHGCVAQITFKHRSLLSYVGGEGVTC